MSIIVNAAGIAGYRQEQSMILMYAQNVIRLTGIRIAGLQKIAKRKLMMYLETILFSICNNILIMIYY